VTQHDDHERLHNDRRALAVALVLILGLTAAELVTGIIAHSPAVVTA
jgi:Co/Zn/Cd efflux system component